jgi:hypothetical protein
LLAAISSVVSRRVGNRLVAASMGRWISLVYVCYRIGVRRFESTKGFNGNEFSSRALVLRGTCMKIS